MKDVEMSAHEATSAAPAQTPQALDEEFKRRAKKPSAAAAYAMLGREQAVTYRERDTPAGHVIRRHPDGRIETVKVDFDVPEKNVPRYRQQDVWTKVPHHRVTAWSWIKRCMSRGFAAFTRPAKG